MLFGAVLHCVWCRRVLMRAVVCSTQRIRATTLVQADTVGEGVRDFLFDAFLHVARHDRPPLATPDGESQPPKGDRMWVPPIDWGRGHPDHPYSPFPLFGVAGGGAGSL